MVLDATLLNTQHYKVGIKGKWSNPVKEAAASPTPPKQLVALNYGQQLYLLLLIMTQGHGPYKNQSKGEQSLQQGNGHDELGLTTKIFFTQSAWGVEYTDCISAEE